MEIYEGFPVIFLVSLIQIISNRRRNYLCNMQKFFFLISSRSGLVLNSRQVCTTLHFTRWLSSKVIFFSEDITMLVRSQIFANILLLLNIFQYIGTVNPGICKGGSVEERLYKKNFTLQQIWIFFFCHSLFTS